jgi:hypothetical protein
MRVEDARQLQVALEHLVVCRCGHDIDEHQADGCVTRKGAERCSCRLARDGVLDSALNAERDDIRRQWLPDKPPQ